MINIKIQMRQTLNGLLAKRNSKQNIGSECVAATATRNAEQKTDNLIGYWIIITINIYIV